MARLFKPALCRGNTVKIKLLIKIFLLDLHLKGGANEIQFSFSSDVIEYLAFCFVFFLTLRSFEDLVHRKQPPGQNCKSCHDLSAPVLMFHLAPEFKKNQDGKALSSWLHEGLAESPLANAPNCGCWGKKKPKKREEMVKIGPWFS